MDVLTGAQTHIDIPNHGWVKLVDVMPRIVSSDRGTCEESIIRSARVSTGNGLKSLSEDVKLLRYLYLHSHTSPFESVKFTFHIRSSIAVRTHFIRHRTANVNEFSQRYSPLDKISTKETFMYKPSNDMRSQDVVNKQGSNGTIDSATDDAIKAEELCSQLFDIYERMLEKGVAREVARLYLPLATFTEFYFTMDLHNLLKFLWLRDDVHTQKETRVFASAMRELITPLVPNVIEIFESKRNGVFFSQDEIDNQELLSVREKKELKDKVDKIRKLC